jgi:hypothetical protein
LWAKFVAAMGGDGVKLIFAMTTNDSPGITATQRKAAADVMTAKSLNSVVVTSNRLTRGILTALSWLGAKVKGFNWDTLESALELIDDPSVRNSVRELAVEFQEREIAKSKS